MARIISVVNQKGGVGKTTTTINLAAYLADLGKRVLVVDIDPQGNASSGFGLDHKQLKKGVYEVLVNPETKITEAVRAHQKNLHILPSTPDLAGAAIELVNQASREYRLRENLNDVLDLYDFILIDNPPSLGLLTINGLVAASEILIPVQCEYYALEGLSQLLSTIDLIKEHLQPELKILGAVMTMHDSRNRLSQAVFDELYQHFPNHIFRSVIPRNVRLAEAPSYGKPIKEYDQHSSGARAYRRLAQEIILTS
ncbi:ParA family protein [bacterium]|jgi:chromosome partitioning protein|nr:ParA family protein [bacterium]MBT4648740.1 ParA family protein [bacterium]